MAAPKFSPVKPTDNSRSYTSPEYVPEAWKPERPGEISGFQPAGPWLGDQGPDQGFALRIASQLRPKLQLQQGEDADDAIQGCLGIALRRASMFSRAPVVHDLTIAFTIWGFYDFEPPDELLLLRRSMFEGLRHISHHYAEAREVVDLVPDKTLQMTHTEVATKYPAEWQTLVGA
jgi:hypothetical protein